MKAHILHSSKLTRKLETVLKNIDNNSILIVTDYNFFKKIKRNYNHEIIFLDLFIDTNAYEKINFSYEILEEINYTSIQDYSSSGELAINKLYNTMSIVVNMLSQLKSTMEKYEIDCLVLYGGSDTEQFLGMTLAEGERPVRLLYKRSWFLNNFIHNSFKAEYKIEWKNKTPALYLKFVSELKWLIILLGKNMSLIKKMVAVKKQNNIEYEKEESCKNYAFIIVRNPIQVSTLVPIYREIIKRNEMTPIFLTLENYSNNQLAKTISKFNVKNYNLFKSLSLSNMFKVNKQIYHMKKSNSNSLYKSFDVAEGNVNLDIHSLTRELALYLFDTQIFYSLLDNFNTVSENDASILINNETHGHHAALEAIWARKKNITSVGIQHVSISDRILPRISWNDVMFVMSNEIANKLNTLKPEENFIYMGPVAYDENFNTSKHKEEFKVITIFTQPDDFKNEYVRIIKDIIEINRRNKLGFEINIKLHPREKDFKLFNKLTSSASNLKIWTNEIDSSSLIAKSDLVLSIHSGVLMQAIIIGTPSISINYESKYNIGLDFIQDEVTKKVHSIKELEEVLRNLSKLNKSYLANRTAYFKNELGEYNGDAAAKIYDHLKQLRFINPG